MAKSESSSKLNLRLRMLKLTARDYISDNSISMTVSVGILLTNLFAKSVHSFSRKI